MKIIFFILFIIPLAFGETFKIAGSLHEFKETEGLLLKGCESTCKALKIIKTYKTISLKKIRKGQKFANSVGSDVCDSLYKADSVLGINEDKDGRAFCVFSDHSMVEMNSLSHYLTSKKIAQ